MRVEVARFRERGGGEAGFLQGLDEGDPEPEVVDTRRRVPAREKTDERT